MRNEMVKEYIKNCISSNGFENDQIRIDFADICEPEDVVEAANELGLIAEPAEGQGVWWLVRKACANA